MFAWSRCSWCWFVLGWTLLAIGAADLARGQTPDADPRVPLPYDPAFWINSPPLTHEVLRGKGVVLYFYEETCPRCRERWPALLETARTFADKPVLFVAVNSGNPRAVVEQYARQNRITWPILVDPQRQFEQAAGVAPQISLQNIMQVRLITATGKLAMGNWNDIPGSAEQALQGAAWRVDPMGMPPALRPAWLAIETGNFPASAKLVKQARASANEQAKAWGDRLHAAVQKEMDTVLATAGEAAAGGREWEAYKAYQTLDQRFTGFDLPAEAAETKAKLATSSAVTAALEAQKTLDLAKRQLRSGATLIRRRALDSLKQLAADHSDNEIGREAAELLQQAGM